METRGGRPGGHDVFNSLRIRTGMAKPFVPYKSRLWRCHALEIARSAGTSTEGPMSFDLYTIIFLVLAVFIFFRLRSVLGQRTGQERPPEPMRREPPPPAVASDKVIPLPTRNAEAVATPAAPPAFRWQG